MDEEYTYTGDMRERPCLNCTVRDQKCHESCKKYAAWRKARKEFLRKRKQKMYIDVFLDTLEERRGER